MLLWGYDVYSQIPMNSTVNTNASVPLYPDASHYVDLPTISADFDEDPITPLLALAETGKIFRGRNGVFNGLAVPNNFLLPDKDQDVFLVLDYDGVRQLAKDNATFSSELAFSETMIKTVGKTIFTMDDPEHARYKKLVLPSFSHRKVNQDLQAFAGPVINDCLEGIVSTGSAELVKAFTNRFPWQVIAGLFGVPESIQDACTEASGDTFLMGSDPERALSAMARLDEMYQLIIDEHRHVQADDMTTLLIETEVDGERLSDAEIRMFMRNIVGAGLDTTSRQTAILIMLLLEHPEQFELLRQQPELIDQAVWESLRICPTGGVFPRIATKDTELCGMHIPKGAGVCGSLRTPNYDERHWENPTEFDITRPKKPLISFSVGPHACLGMSLALSEMRIAMQAVLERLPNLRKDEDRWHSAKMRGYQFRSPTQLPVKWDVT